MNYWKITVHDRTIYIKAVGPHTAISRAFKGFGMSKDWKNLQMSFNIGNPVTVTIKQVHPEEYNERGG